MVKLAHFESNTYSNEHLHSHELQFELIHHQIWFQQADYFLTSKLGSEDRRRSVYAYFAEQAANTIWMGYEGWNIAGKSMST